MVITGGNRGIGYEAVKKLLGLGFHIILGKFFWLLFTQNEMTSLPNWIYFTGVRRPNEFYDKINKEEIVALNEATVGTFEALELDLTSLDSVKSFANKILAMGIGIDVLMNNAGIMFGPRRETKDGIEMQLATNYFGHFLLTSMLMPKLKQAGRPDACSRIINVSSAAHHGGCWINWDDIQSK